MARDSQKLVVIGHGAAGLAAALSAAEHSLQRGLPVDITVLEKSREDEAGGNTRWSPSNMRLDGPDRLDAGFEDDMLSVSGGRADRSYFRTLADNAVQTIGWLQTHGIEFVIPLYYLSAGPARIQPVGGGAAIVEKLRDAAKRTGVTIRYQSEAIRLVMAEGRVVGVETSSGDGVTTTVDADAVILGCGGFQGNPAMMRAHFGPDAETIKLI
jgi:tricarballylate dehydrogenase